MVREVQFNTYNPIFGVIESIVRITITNEEYEEIKTILGIKTSHIRREHKGRILKYILDKYKCSDIFRNYNIWFSMLENEVTFTYDALIQENFNESDFVLLRSKLCKDSI